MALTQNQVRTAMESLAARGESVSSRAVRAEIGSGSLGTVQKLMAIITDEQADKPDTELQLPDELIKALKRLMADARRTGYESRGAAVEQARDAMVDALDALDRSETVVAQLKQDLAGSQERIGALSAKLEVAKVSKIAADDAARVAAERATEAEARQSKQEARFEKDLQASTEQALVLTTKLEAVQKEMERERTVARLAGDRAAVAEARAHAAEERIKAAC